MTSVDREPSVLLAEAAPMLAFRATAALYEEQPALWQMGERGRARTLEDFGHHFEALATLDQALFREHVVYCQALFKSHKFTSAWLTDAWRVMSETITHELPPAVAEQALRVLRAGSDVPAQNSRRDRA
jgi:hypothetical protein